MKSQTNSRLGQCGSELRPAIDVDGVAGDPSRIFGCQKGDDTADVVGLRQALGRLHAQREVPARLRFGEARHICLDDARCHGIDADTTCAKHRGEMLHQSVDGALGSCIRWNRANDCARPERRDEHDTAALRQDRKELLHKKEGSAYVDGEQLIEILNGVILDRCGFRDTRIGDKNIEAIADDVAGEFCELVRPIGRRQIGRDRVSAATGLAYLADYTVMAASSTGRCNTGVKSLR